MSDDHFISFIAQVDKLELRQAEYLKLYVDKHLRFLDALNGKERDDDFPTLQKIKRVLGARGLELLGTEATLLACWYVQLSGADSFNAKQINALLLDCGCKPANTSTALDTVRNRRWVEVVSGDEVGRHKTYRVTSEGISESRRLLEVQPSNILDYPAA